MSFKELALIGSVIGALVYLGGKMSVSSASGETQAPNQFSIPTPTDFKLLDGHDLGNNDIATSVTPPANTIIPTNTKVVWQDGAPNEGTRLDVIGVKQISGDIKEFGEVFVRHGDIGRGYIWTGRTAPEGLGYQEQHKWCLANGGGIPARTQGFYIPTGRECIGKVSL